MKVFTWQARMNKGMSLAELAKLTGLNVSTLNDIENEKISPKLIQLEAIAKATGTRMQDLYDSPNK